MAALGRHGGSAAVAAEAVAAMPVGQGTGIGRGRGVVRRQQEGDAAQLDQSGGNL